MLMGEKGCEIGTPGIGDIAYVKDLQKKEIVSTTFRCSQFGVGHHQKSMIGWVSEINKCNQNKQKLYQLKYSIEEKRNILCSILEQ